ncbi:MULTISPECIES: hypothetical protein [unclassified Streptomyces]|nr:MULTISPECIES: hypothetical protein [unclassified Streptomyces]
MPQGFGVARLPLRRGEGADDEDAGQGPPRKAASPARSGGTSW